MSDCVTLTHFSLLSALGVFFFTYGTACIIILVSNNNNQQINGDLGRKLSSFSGEERATSFLFQRLLVSLQRFHSVLLHDTFMIDDVPDQ